MTTNTIQRKKHTGEPGNGGQFGSTVRSPGGVELTVETRRLAEAPIERDVCDGITTFTPDEIGSDLPAKFVDAYEVTAEAGIDVDDNPSDFDRVTHWFHQDEYDATVDMPDYDDESIQVKFSAYVKAGVSTRQDAVDAVDSRTPLRRYLTERADGTYEQKLADYRAKQVTFDSDAARQDARKYEGTVGSRQVRSDAENGEPAGILVVLVNTAHEARRLSNSVTPHRFKHLSRLTNTGVTDREEAIAECGRAAELFARYSRRDEAAAILSVQRWLQEG